MASTGIAPLAPPTEHGDLAPRRTVSAEYSRSSDPHIAGISSPPLPTLNHIAPQHAGSPHFHPPSQDAHPSTVLHRAGSADDLSLAGLELSEQEAGYKVSEHKKEVRLGLRHRDSFAVHRSHLNGPSKTDSIMAALAGRNRNKSVDSDVSDSDEDISNAEIDAALEGIDSPRKKSALKSMAKGVGSFLGLRKSKKQRLAEEASRAAAAEGPVTLAHKGFTVKDVMGPLPTADTQPVAPASGGLDGIVIPEVPKPAVPSKTPSGKAPPPAKPRSSSMSSVTSQPSVSETREEAEKPADGAVTPPRSTPPPAPETQASPLSPPPGPPPMPAAPAPSPVPAVTSPAAIPPAPAPAPPIPRTTSPPQKPAAPLIRPHSTGHMNPTTPSTPIPPPPPPSAVPAASTPAPDSGRKTHQRSAMAATPKSILKSTPRDGSKHKRKISFADQHGGDLEDVKWCDDLHYSAMADHSESEYDGVDGQQKCAIM